MVETRIYKLNRRIEAEVQQPVLNKNNSDQINSLIKEYEECIAMAEKAAESGDITAAAQYNNRAVVVNVEIEKISTQSNGLQMQKENELRICDICGAMQSVGDTMARFESHVMGKQHIGFERIRACIARLKEKHAAKEKRFPHKKYGGDKFDKSSTGSSFYTSAQTNRNYQAEKKNPRGYLNIGFTDSEEFEEGQCWRGFYLFSVSNFQGIQYCSYFVKLSLSDVIRANIANASVKTKSNIMIVNILSVFLKARIPLLPICPKAYPAAKQPTPQMTPAAKSEYPLIVP